MVSILSIIVNMKSQIQVDEVSEIMMDHLQRLKIYVMVVFLLIENMVVMIIHLTYD